MSEQYYVMCAILGHKTGPFQVKIDSNANVAGLKSRIKAEQPQTLGSLDSTALKLYHVNIRVPNMYKTFMQSILQGTVEFNRTSELDNPFLGLRETEKGFSVGLLHILVEITQPIGESFSSRPSRDVVEIVLSLLSPGASRETSGRV